MLLFLAQALAGSPQLEGARLDAQTEPSPRIINGEGADLAVYPMTGAVIIDADVKYGRQTQHIRMLLCSSTLIAPDVVLLAAHCIDDYVLTFGMAELSNKQYRWTRQADLSDFDGATVPEWPEDAVQAWDWVAHSSWDMQNLKTGLAENHDLAILFLDEAVTDVPFAYLPTQEEGAQVVQGAEVDVVGWGQQVASESAWDQPAPGTFAIKVWGQSYINELAAFEMQIGGVEDDVRKCHGDSGGPSFLKVRSESPEKTRLIGVTSHAYDQTECDSKGGVDTRVDFYLEWIEQELADRCADGTRSWCEEAGIPALPEPPPPPAEDDDGGETAAAGGCGCASTRHAGVLPALFTAFLLVRRRVLPSRHTLR